ncbi:NAD(P)/FAD-dependent oxidoreductase [Kordiimonas marina]|uniref:NAD(P)/FAD-dependent oxidoreductase n=1 Tax=Kordiimonas marina TaxID=2872312 RepID=UPI001FF49C22|nr:FAD-dependent oxidoreductase [Kordiimonas marina]MCJ9429415.1 FAD-dependent oxidoreductase [Kordiimonas marina]
MTHIVIVGGGHAAAQAVTSLRQNKFEGDVTLISDEPVLPYQRPPLSKAYLSGDLAAERLPILRQVAYENAGVTLKLGLRATRIDRAAKQLELGDGEVLPYDYLILATGGHARRLTCPGHDLKGLHYVRTMADTDAMRAEFLKAEKLVVIGGGYIGLETAAVARKMGKKVTVLEAADRILSRVVAPEVSACYQAIHEAEGVTVLTHQMVTEIEGKDGHVAAVLTEDGGRYEADMVVAGIGLVANADLAAAAELDVHPMGIVVDDHCRTTDPAIYAVGDVTWHHNALYGRDMRLESVQNAVDQAKVAVENMLGEDVVYDTLPWFWSDQYGMKLQIAGLSQGYDTLVTRGDAAARSVAFFYLKDGVMIAADCVGRVAEFMGAKKLIAERVPVTVEALTDESRSFKEIVTGFLTA